MKRRVLIFVFYNPKGIVYKYVENVLEEIKKHVTHILIVVNGKLLSSGEKKLKKYANDILVRDNDGYDGEAFKCGFSYLRKNHNIEEYEELLLANDTFFGFFHPLDDFFYAADNKLDADLIGMTYFEHNKDNPNMFPSHAQSYFLLIKERLLKSDFFIEFWNKFEKPQNYIEAVFNFEVQLSRKCIENGYKVDSVYRLRNLNIREEGNPFFYNTFELIKDLRLPIFKRKAFEWADDGCISALRYISSNNMYDVEEIYNYYKEMYDSIPGFGTDSFFGLYSFATKHNRVYAYGRYAEKFCNIMSFISSGDYTVVDEKSLSNIKFEKKDGFFIADDPDGVEKCMPVIVKKVPFNILYHRNMGGRMLLKNRDYGNLICKALDQIMYKISLN